MLETVEEWEHRLNKEKKEGREGGRKEERHAKRWAIHLKGHIGEPS